jgi:hypothetical protein
MNASHPLDRLAKWYSDNCDGGWEHQSGVEITTLDNPGWHLLVDLDDTELLNVPFDAVEDGLDGQPSWHCCKRDDYKFHAFCSPDRLTAVIEIFVDWAERHSAQP